MVRFPIFVGDCSVSAKTASAALMNGWISSILIVRDLLRQRPGWPRFHRLVHNAKSHRARRVSRAFAQSVWHPSAARRSEEHTSELQSRLHLVCRLLLEKKKKQQKH